MLTIDARAMIASLRASGVEIERSSRIEIRQAAALARAWAASHAPGRIGGTIRQSKTSPDHVEVSSNWKKVGFLEFGTRAHQITAKGGVMRFKVNGSFVFAKTVDHPGNKAYRFMQGGLDAGERHMASFAEGLLR